MGLFSRKSPEEKRIKKFSKTEKKLQNNMDKINTYISELFFLSTQKEEYLKVTDYYREWILKYVTAKLPTINIWINDGWNAFESININSLISFMVIGEYDDCLTYCNKILEYEDMILKTRIVSGMQGGLLTIGKLVAASTGAGGNKKQTTFIKKINFIKCICLCELGKNQEVLSLLSEFPEDYGLTFDKGDKYSNDYFEKNFKYKGSIFVSDIIKLLE